jgi:hypothetical protein
MRLIRFTKENYEPFKPEFSEGDEINANRMREDAIKVFEGGGGTIDFNLHYPPNNSPESNFLASGLYNTWTLTPQADNDGVADSAITDFANTNSVLTAAWSGTVAVGHLVYVEGATNSANNGVHRCTTASATVPRFIASTFTNESAPPAACKAMVVGFRGAAGDITAAANGLASTLLDFTTLGLTVGQAIKIGNADVAGESFATAALNGWAVIDVIAANALTLSNLPTGWTTDAGTAKTISVWFGDFLKNGTLTDATRVSLTIEKGFLGQATPTYLAQPGNTVDQLTFSFKHKDKIRVTAALKAGGGTGTQDTTSLDASPDAKTSDSNLSANVNFKRLCEGGAALASANRARALEITVSNNLREIEDITQAYAAGLNEGQRGRDQVHDLFRIGRVADEISQRDGDLAVHGARQRRPGGHVLHSAADLPERQSGRERPQYRR